MKYELSDECALNLAKYVVSRIEDDEWTENETVYYDGYEIRQFGGTLFSSDYQCYAVQKVGGGEETRFVIKLTNGIENLMLNYLGYVGFPVPTLIKTLNTKRPCEKTLIVFEGYIDGAELSHDSEIRQWKRSVQKISEIHSRFWSIDPNRLLGTWNESYDARARYKENTEWSNKVSRAESSTTHIPSLAKAMSIAKERLRVMPHTLCHGDLFPTNILISDENPYFIDWADADYLPYTSDLARLITVADDNGEPICPDPEELIQKYYDCIKGKLKSQYREYKKDVLSAQFVELASIYLPPIGLNKYSVIVRSHGNTVIGEKLSNIANQLLDQGK